MDRLMNWISFAAVVYIIGVKAWWWPGPLTAWRSYRHRHAGTDADTDADMTNRRSDSTDTLDEEDDDMSVSVSDDGPIREFAPGVYVAPDPRVRVVRAVDQGRPWGPRPLDELLREHPTDPQPDDAGDVVSSRTSGRESPRSGRRRWVREQLTAGRRPIDIVTEGARRWDCAERTIERDIAHVQRAARQRDSTR